MTTLLTLPYFPKYSLLTRVWLDNNLHSHRRYWVWVQSHKPGGSALLECFQGFLLVMILFYHFQNDYLGINLRIPLCARRYFGFWFLIWRDNITNNSLINCLFDFRYHLHYDLNYTQLNSRDGTWKIMLFYFSTKISCPSIISRRFKKNHLNFLLSLMESISFSIECTERIKTDNKPS
jgi:hypothetical protein